MSSHPSSTLRMHLTSPPPSQALLELQKQGLELAISPPPHSLQVAPHHASGRSTPSDLDKPLPLEPFEEKKRRSSSVYSVDRGSVYSTDTTITNILRLYGEYRELDDIPPMPLLHQPQAYRDTVAPLLIRRLSLTQSPPPRPIVEDAPREAPSAASLRSAAAQSDAIPRNKDAPTFTEFSRQLLERRDQLVLPQSVSSADMHRQAAYDQLAPPSPQVSSIEMSISMSHTPPLPDAVSVSISDASNSDLLPPPLAMSSSSLPSPPFDDWEKPAEFNPARHQDHEQSPLHNHGHNRSWSQNWLEDGFVTQSPRSSPVESWPRQSFRPSSPLPRRDLEPGTTGAEAPSPSSKRESRDQNSVPKDLARSSIQQGVGVLLRSLSHKSAAESQEWPEDTSNPPRERQLAIPATPYQVYGAEIFSGKLQKKQQREAEYQARQAQEAQRARRQRGKSMSLASAYHKGQNGLVASLRKLTTKSSQKRQRKLKDSIILLGTAETRSSINALQHATTEREDSWI
ncbi:hypothetical protein A1O7_05427 [Cladophialophora yegresii CBS 114405]|uniref:Uncharacterized protein n=1 Tax=Cladophialophora yegresii CBS 114405 TaxID=1182544 RepID=W9WHM4_9EURO|nr:uncharacterized protein A1O7_05427 [Cladophialophora yegresii CBS 114405]EXJ58004.1 hypothetical protein A1O7_05427 [Cladophialophora yegresii CBS 114405]